MLLLVSIINLLSCNYYILTMFIVLSCQFDVIITILRESYPYITHLRGYIMVVFYTSYALVIPVYCVFEQISSVRQCVIPSIQECIKCKVGMHYIKIIYQMLSRALFLAQRMVFNIWTKTSAMSWSGVYCVMCVHEVLVSMANTRCCLQSYIACIGVCTRAMHYMCLNYLVSCI